MVEQSKMTQNWMVVGVSITPVVTGIPRLLVAYGSEVVRGPGIASFYLADIGLITGARAAWLVNVDTFCLSRHFLSSLHWLEDVQDAGDYEECDVELLIVRRQRGGLKLVIVRMLIRRAFFCPTCAESRELGEHRDEASLRAVTSRSREVL